jgi:hypothetical protein
MYPSTTIFTHPYPYFRAGEIKFKQILSFCEKFSPATYPFPSFCRQGSNLRTLDIIVLWKSSLLLHTPTPIFVYQRSNLSMYYRSAKKFSPATHALPYFCLSAIKFEHVLSFCEKVLSCYVPPPHPYFCLAAIKIFESSLLIPFGRDDRCCSCRVVTCICMMVAAHAQWTIIFTLRGIIFFWWFNWATHGLGGLLRDENLSSSLVLLPVNIQPKYTVKTVTSFLHCKNRFVWINTEKINLLLLCQCQCQNYKSLKTSYSHVNL